MRWALLLSMLIITAGTRAQEKVDPAKALYDHLVADAMARLEHRRWEVDQLRGPEDIRKRQETLRAKFLESLGAFPDKAPLNAKVAGTVKGEGFRVEKVIYESRPNH